VPPTSAHPRLLAKTLTEQLPMWCPSASTAIDYT
jgi:hypothetical protein